jgi:hypothetical protein
MRVSMSAGGVPSACETFSYGEVEDYSIEIIDGNGNTFQTNKFSSFGNYNIINKFILECSTDDEAALTLRIQW